MGKLEVEYAKIGGGESLSAALDMRSRRLKAVHFPATWATGKISFAGAANADDTFGTVGTADGTEVTLDGDDSEFILAPADVLEGLSFVKVRSGTASAAVNQGTAASFTVTPDAGADFSAATVTFTFTYEDGTSDEVALDADYTDADGLTTELNTQCDGVTWTNSTGALTAARTGVAVSITLTAIDDDTDLMGFTTATIAEGDTSTSTDTIIALLTEPRS